MKSRSLRDI